MYDKIDDLRMRELEWDFPTRPTRPDDATNCLRINEAAKAFAKTVIETVPWSPDRDRATKAIRHAALLAKEAMLTHNFLIDCDHLNRCCHKHHAPSPNKTNRHDPTVPKQWAHPEKDVPIFPDRATQAGL